MLRRLPPWVLATASGLLVVAVTLIAVGFALDRGSTPSPSRSDPVESLDRSVPQSISTIPLVDQNGQATDLAALHGRTIILADFMTSCQEECPITTGALLDVQDVLAADHLQNKVAIVEVSVDPTRDIPSRLLAYQAKFGVHWTMLTGTAANLQQLWKWFGVFYEKVAEGSPPSINWQTGQPYTYDINHSDALFVLNTDGNERELVTGEADVTGKLPASLRSLLDGQGRHELSHPGYGSWSPRELLDAVSSVLGQPVPG